MNELHDLQKVLLHQLNVLARFGEMALRSPSLDDILDQACRLVRHALGTDFAKIMVLESDGQTLILRSGAGWEPGVVGRVLATGDPRSSEGYALNARQPVVSVNVQREKRFDYTRFLHEHQVHALVNVPILGAVGKPLYGLLEVDSKTPRKFTERDVDFLRTYASLIAAAVERFNGLDELRASEAALRRSEEHYRVAVDRKSVV